MISNTEGSQVSNQSPVRGLGEGKVGRQRNDSLKNIDVGHGRLRCRRGQTHLRRQIVKERSQLEVGGHHLPFPFGLCPSRVDRVPLRNC